MPTVYTRRAPPGSRGPGRRPGRGPRGNFFQQRGRGDLTRIEDAAIFGALVDDEHKWPIGLTIPSKALAQAMTIRTAEEFVELRTTHDGRAARDDAPIAVWRDVIDRYPDMHFWVAQNKTVPVEILECLAGSADANARRMVAMRRKATPALLGRLATDGHDGVRAAVARHRSTPRAVLESLLDDESDEVRDIARARLA